MSLSRLGWLILRYDWWLLIPWFLVAAAISKYITPLEIACATALVWGLVAGWWLTERAHNREWR